LGRGKRNGCKVEPLLMYRNNGNEEEEARGAYGEGRFHFDSGDLLRVVTKKEKLKTRGSGRNAQNERSKRYSALRGMSEREAL